MFALNYVYVNIMMTPTENIIRTSDTSVFVL